MPKRKFNDMLEETLKSDDVCVVVVGEEEAADTTPPVSSLLPVEPYWQPSMSFSISASANDPSGVKSVEFWYRHSSDNVARKKHDWQLYGVDANGADGWSWSFTAPYGYGYYEFYSVATDRAGKSLF